MPLTPTIWLERGGDFAAIEAVLDAASDGTDGSRIVREVRASDAYLPALSLVAEEGEDVVGHVLFSRGWLVSEDHRRPILCLGPVAVRPDRQRRGIGIALNERGLEEARRGREPLVVVLGHAEYYPRFGFERASAHGIARPSRAFRTRCSWCSTWRTTRGRGAARHGTQRPSVEGRAPGS
ncbi:MAG TPA: N-acetyltransferase [Actinomycetota bacterium]